MWLTLKATPDASDPATREDLITVNDYLKPVNILYLTQQTTDSRFLSKWVRGYETSWGTFAYMTITAREVPPIFPLRKMPAGYLPDQLVLTDWERYRQ
jgi:hypothetical protein